MEVNLTRGNKVLKVVLWRILSLVLGWILAYFYMGSVSKSLELSLVIGTTMTIVHYIFEKQWEKLPEKM